MNENDLCAMYSRILSSTRSAKSFGFKKAGLYIFKTIRQINEITMQFTNLLFIMLHISLIIILGRSRLFVFNFCFNPRDLYYRGYLLRWHHLLFSIRRKHRRSPAAGVTSQSDGGRYRHNSLTGEEHMVISSAQQSTPDRSFSP